MKVNKLSIFKLLDILQGFQDKGHEYVMLEVTDSKDKESYIVTLHPIEAEEQKPDADYFDKDIIF